MNLSDTSSVVVGGSSGLGMATAVLLRSHGAKVVIVGRDRERLSLAAVESGATPRVGDVFDDESISGALRAAAELGPLRSVVISAGRGHAERLIGRAPGGPVHGLDTFRQTLEVNLVGTFNVLRHAAVVMSQQPPEASGQRGAVLMTSSLAAISGTGGQAAYAAAKAGLLGLLRPSALDLGVHGIRINAIIPGGFDTPIFGPSGPSPMLREAIGATVLFPNRMGSPEEFASLAVELLANDYINGAAFEIAAGARTLPYVTQKRPRQAEWPQAGQTILGCPLGSCRRA